MEQRRIEATTQTFNPKRTIFPKQKQSIPAPLWKKLYQDHSDEHVNFFPGTFSPFDCCYYSEGQVTFVSPLEITCRWTFENLRTTLSNQKAHKSRLPGRACRPLSLGPGEQTCADPEVVGWLRLLKVGFGKVEWFPASSGVIRFPTAFDGPTKQHVPTSDLREGANHADFCGTVNKPFFQNKYFKTGRLLKSNGNLFQN